MSRGPLDGRKSHWNPVASPQKHCPNFTGKGTAIQRGEATTLEVTQGCMTAVIPSLYRDLVVRDPRSRLSLNIYWAPWGKSVWPSWTSVFPSVKWESKFPPGKVIYCEGSTS